MSITHQLILPHFTKDPASLVTHLIKFPRVCPLKATHLLFSEHLTQMLLKKCHNLSLSRRKQQICDLVHKTDLYPHAFLQLLNSSIIRSLFLAHISATRRWQYGKTGPYLFCILLTKSAFISFQEINTFQIRLSIHKYYFINSSTHLTCTC